jgi:class 3 adenylate cyclase
MADLAEWLAGLGLAKYAPAFAAQEIDFEVLRRLTDDDVRELGLPIGPRRRLLDALAALRGDPSSDRRDHLAPRSNAERRQLTVMFVDLASSTNLALRLDPEAMREVLRAYQNAVGREIGRVGGHVAKLMGDGVLAYFGWPQAHEDDAERAARAGLAVADVVAILTSPLGEPLACRVGIATGVVVVGDLIGDGAAQEHAVVGTTPNLAARLQEAAGPGEVLIAAATRQLLGAGFVVEAIGERLLKGHDQPVPLFRVLAHKPETSRFDARRDAAPGPIVGRAAELGGLLETWRLAKSAHGQAAVVAGEPGIGKSRLVRALIDRIAKDTPAQTIMQCSPFRSDSPLWPFLQQLRMAAKIAPDDGTAKCREKLARHLAARVADPSRAAAVLMPLLGAPDEPDDAGADRAQRRSQTLDALIEQATANAGSSSGLIVFEDAQWSDRASIELLRSLIAAIADKPILLIVTTRIADVERLGEAAHLTRIALAPLDREAAAAVVAAVAGVASVPTKLAREIVARGDGIPLFIEEITKAVIEAATPAGAAIAVPATLRDSLIARLDGVPAMKAVAQIAACIGRDFEEPLLAQVSDIPPGELREGLDALVQAGLARADGDGHYAFKNQLICDIAYETLLTPRRQQLHARIAQAIEAMPGDRAHSEPELLARHWFAAGQGARAETYWLQARHRAAHWQDQLDSLADYLDSADPADTGARDGSDPPGTIH